jgi:hypothetical protein
MVRSLCPLTDSFFELGYGFVFSEVGMLYFILEMGLFLCCLGDG